MQIGWRAGLPPGPGKRAPDTPASRRLRIGARAIGSLATVLLAIVGCTSVIEGTATVDTAIAPAYRASVSASISASSATSSIRESQRQVSLTKQAVVRACTSFATSSKEAIDRVNEFVAAYNQDRATGPSEGPAIDALNHSADVAVGGISNPLSAELRDAFNAYADAAREVAAAIRSHAGPSEFNRRVNQLNDTKSKTAKICLAS
ncbi:MAG: hypothetical protein ACRDUT_20195 [Mycobacterium sp.]